VSEEVVSMATIMRAVGMVPVKDYERAKSWYADKLGLKPVEEMGQMGAYYEVGESRFLLYPSQFAGTNQATAIALEVDDVEAMVAETGIQLEPHQARRNVVTRGVELRRLIGRRFRVGEEDGAG
jgi:catechol 2,3-dioxygenase-like lactoylglutathione lyase family enzyme